MAKPVPPAQGRRDSLSRLSSRESLGARYVGVDLLEREMPTDSGHPPAPGLLPARWDAPPASDQRRPSPAAAHRPGRPGGPGVRRARRDEAEPQQPGDLGPPQPDVNALDGDRDRWQDRRGAISEIRPLGRGPEAECWRYDRGDRRVGTDSLDACVAFKLLESIR